MQDCKPIFTPLPINFKLSSSMSPSNEAERMEIVATQFLTHILINFQIKNKKNNNKGLHVAIT
jgi:hypothetical protein